MPAVRWAAEESLALQRPLHLVLAFGLPTMGVSPVSASEGLDRTQAEALAATAAAELQADFTGLRLECELVQDRPAQALVDRSAHAEVVVVGSRQKSRVGRLVLGSVASAVVSQAQAPVIVLRGDASGQVRRTGPVVVGVDGSPASEDAVRFALEHAPQHGSEVVAVHAGDAPAEGLAALSPALAAARTAHPAVQVREVVRAGNPAELLLAQAPDASLLVVGSRGHGGVRGLMLGSVSRAVVEQSTSSVVVMRTVTAPVSVPA
jgi:nucleotide-binding universal stress UspA family protein